MMALDDGSVAAAALHHIGIDRSLCQHIDFPEFFRFGFKNADEFLADDSPLFLRLGDARQPAQEAFLRVDSVQMQTEAAAEGLLHKVAFVFPQQAVVDEHADQIVPDGTVQQQGGDR